MQKNTKIAKTKMVKIKVNELDPEPLELLAQSIINVSNAFEAINNTRLNKSTLVLLIQAHIGSTNITRLQISDVLDTVPKLKDIYLKK